MANIGCENDFNDSSPSPVTILTRKLAFASFDSTPCEINKKSIFDDDQATPLASKTTIQRQKKIGRRFSKSKSQSKSECKNALFSSVYDECANLDPPTLDDVSYFMSSDLASLSSESSGFVEGYGANRFAYGKEDSKDSRRNQYSDGVSNDEGFDSNHTLVNENHPSLAKYYQSPELSASPVLSFNKNSNFHRTASNDSDASFLRRRSSVPVLGNLVRQNSLTAEMAGGYFERRDQLGLNSLSNFRSNHQNSTYKNSPTRGKVTASVLDDTVVEEVHKVTPKRRKPCFIASGDTPLLPGGTIESPNSRNSSKSKILGCAHSPVVNFSSKISAFSNKPKQLSDVTNTLTRCHSISSTLDEKKIANSISSRDAFFLAGDSKSRSVLPTLETTGQGRQFEIPCISTETVSDLIQGCYHQCVSNFTIVDCRYPYEYYGGHISDAINVYTHDQLLDIFFRKSEHSVHSRRHIRLSDNERKSVLIFHCEFSSKRAPTLAKFLRSVDRSSNFHQYPNLFFPEIYVMKGGYSDFYKRCPEMCSPHSYIKMFDQRFRNDLKTSEKECKESKISCLMRVRNDQDDLSPVPLPSLRNIENCVEFGSQSTTTSPTVRLIR